MSGNKVGLNRLKKEFLKLQKEPVPHIEAVPLEDNILEWHYVIKGPKDSPYHNGIYHGKLRFPPEYPYKPPSILMCTPSGRFKTNERLCLSMSDFHPETWNPMWSVATILQGLLSFMLENEITHGSVDASPEQRRLFASSSLAFNLRQPIFVKLFPHYTAATSTTTTTGTHSSDNDDKSSSSSNSSSSSSSSGSTSSSSDSSSNSSASGSGNSSGASSSTSSPTEEKSLIGQTVTIAGLVSKPELNSKTGTVISYDSDSGRFQVEVNGTPYMFKRANLKERTADDPPCTIHA